MNPSAHAPLPPPAPAGGVSSTSSLAIVSLVFGVLCWVVLPLVGSVVAIICGHLARAEIRRERNTGGDGLAVAGLVLGYANVALVVVGVLAAVLFFGGLAALLAFGAVWS